MKKSKIFIIILILLLILGIYFVIKYFSSKESNYEHLKKYEVNEYIPTYVSDSDMSKIYLNDYLYYLRCNISKAYDLLDEKYKKDNFSTIEKFKDYVKTMDLNNIRIKKYYINSDNNYVIYNVFISDNDIIAFETNGIMQYKVYFDQV